MVWTSAATGERLIYPAVKVAAHGFCSYSEACKMSIPEIVGLLEIIEQREYDAAQAQADAEFLAKL